jgi:hypothetical protein
MKDLKFIQACPDDAYYIWQVHTWLESLKNIGKSDKAISLIFTPDFREFNTKWKELEALYPESEFFYVKDVDGISKILGTYIPVLRPYSLMKYFNEHPDMVSKAVFYCDCDVVFTENFNIDAYIDDDKCYVSDTNSYINASYFDSKINDVKPDRLEAYKEIDVLAGATSLVGITREIAEKHNLHSGGAQYLLKNIGGSFWEKVIGDCLMIKTYLGNVNKQFFESENKGFQSWCADMWAVLWNLWLREQETVVIPEMEFAWSSDHISKLEKVGILHNAGIVSNSQGDIPTFYKGNYHPSKNPFNDPHLSYVLNDERSKTLCNHYYLQQMFNIKNKYNLDYGHN